MKNRLEPILLQKKQEVSDLYQRIQRDANDPIAKALCGDFKSIRSVTFKSALKSTSLAVIAEIKRKSPSKGVIASIVDPAELATRYIQGGASAVSILTDQVFFNGHINDLIEVSRITRSPSIPILRKDFIIDPIQIAEAALAGASAVLCIISAVGKEARPLIDFARQLGLDVLVEIHDKSELQLALDCGADIIGVNSRNLTTFEVDIRVALGLADLIPAQVVKVAESGITEPLLARQCHKAGFDAVLIGEALVRSSDPEQFIRDCHNG